jgi:hypothetical protein
MGQKYEQSGINEMLKIRNREMVHTEFLYSLYYRNAYWVMILSPFLSVIQKFYAS